MSKKKMSLAQKVNVLRASVMGANDGIISIAGIVIGVAAATSNARSILINTSMNLTMFKRNMKLKTSIHN